MKTRFSFVVVVALVLAGALFVAFSGIASADPSDEDLPDPEVYLAFGQVIVTSTVSPVTVGSIPLTKTVAVEGRPFWKGPEVSGTDWFSVDNSMTYWFLQATDLQFSEVYTDLNGIRLEANPKNWGRTGIVSYVSSGDRQVYTLAGYGYDLKVPAGTLFWNYDLQEWLVEPKYGFFTAISVLRWRPEPPTLTLEGPTEISAMGAGFYTATLAGEYLSLPIEFRWEATDHRVFTDTREGIQDMVSLSWGTPGMKTVQVSAEGVTTTLVVTITPKMYQVFLPLVTSNRPPTCLENTPLEVTSWQTALGYAVCSQEQPAAVEGMVPVRVQHERYNWLYTGVFGPQAAEWLAPGGFEDDLISLSTETQAGLVAVCSDCQGFRRVYAVWGLGYRFLYWPNEANWYDGTQWVSESQWSEYTLIGIR